MVNKMLWWLYLVGNFITSIMKLVYGTFAYDQLASARNFARVVTG